MFAETPAGEQSQLLDRVCDRRRGTAADVSGAQFFDWAPRLTVDMFYTHPAGYREVDHRGGKEMTTFAVPAEALEKALTKANLK